MAKATMVAEKTETTFEKGGKAANPQIELDEGEPKSVMTDDRSEKERIADIRRANQDRLVTLAREIESGKPALIHPIVLTDLDFMLQYTERLERKVRLYEKKLEFADG